MLPVCPSCLPEPSCLDSLLEKGETLSFESQHYIDPTNTMYESFLVAFTIIQVVQVYNT